MLLQTWAISQVVGGADSKWAWQPATFFSMTVGYPPRAVALHSALGEEMVSRQGMNTLLGWGDIVVLHKYQPWAHMLLVQLCVSICRIWAWWVLTADAPICPAMLPWEWIMAPPWHHHGTTPEEMRSI